MENNVKSKKKLIIDIIIALLILLTISLITMIILFSFNILSFDKGFKFNPTIFDSFKNAWYGWIIFILIQSFLSILLSAIPGASMAFIILSTTIYKYQWQAFILSLASVSISSTIMYTIGRFGSYKLWSKFLGQKDIEKSLELLKSKSTVYFPLMMTFPLFPDDALVMMAGAVKMSLKWFIPSIIVGRGIGILTIVYGLTIIPFSSFTSIYDWLVCITVFAFWLIIIFKLANKLDKKINEKKEDKVI